MALRKLLIADSNEDFLLAMAAAMQGRYHVLCCQDGKRALELLRREKCDMFMLDLMLPELDGITLLETAAAEGLRPVVFVATPLVNQYVLDSAQRLGIGYLVRKPCDVQAIAARIDDLSKMLHPPVPKQNDRELVSDLLLSLGLVPKYDGYDYLLEAILRLDREPGQAFTKVLYPAVGKQFCCSGSQVERSIRNALDAAWKRRDDAIWQQYFPPSGRRPTASAAITRLTEVLGQWKSE